MKHIMKTFAVLMLALVIMIGCAPTSTDPTPSPKDEVTSSPKSDPTQTPNATSTPRTTNSIATPRTTPRPTSSPSAKPTSTPKPALTPKPTVKPTPKPTPRPTSTPKPTEKPTPKPTYGSSATLADMDPSDYKGKYVGSAKSDKYHYTSCRWAQKILIHNAVWWNSTSSARSAGYKACGTCHP